MERYKELYNYSKEAFEREYDRFKNIDQKATQYLSVLTLLIGIAGFFVNWVVANFVPPKNIFEFILFVLAILILITLTITQVASYKLVL
jgi:predicted MFS family arabinose efflux permease